ncbi:MAG: hypothetical protein QNJ68_08030 [Microcoleaceae cyanobacterium MO_207.B10]|nr:hypothetical protein [Microcoleaceae cyanobacterium MO_207.B10]
MEWEQLTVYHYGTAVGTCSHQGSYIDVDSALVNELAKYDCDLEGFMVENDISYELTKGIKVYTPKIRPDLHLGLKWDDWYCPNSGTINGHYFYYKRNDIHGDYIELIHNHQPYFSFSGNIPSHIKPYFDYIWNELRETGNIEFPREISLGSKVAARLPDGFKAYRVDDDEDQCRVERTRQKYCYIKKMRDCEYYTSFSENWGLYPSIKSKSLEEAVEAVPKVLELTEKM